MSAHPTSSVPNEAAPQPDNGSSRHPGHIDESVIFLHLPKTAGTTVNRLIEWEYRLRNVFNRSGPSDISRSPAKTPSRASQEDSHVQGPHDVWPARSAPTTCDLYHRVAGPGGPSDFGLLFHAELQTASTLLEAPTQEMDLGRLCSQLSTGQCSVQNRCRRAVRKALYARDRRKSQVQLEASL
jgi:hypothetical protein